MVKHAAEAQAPVRSPHAEVRLAVTELLEAPVAPAAANMPRRTPRGRVFAALVVGLVVASGIAVWVVSFLPGLDAVNQTQVLLDARPFVCKNKADVTTYTPSDDTSDDEAVFVPAVRVHPGLDCTMDIVIRNDGDADVSVDKVTIPMAGASNGWGVHADRGYLQGIAPAGGRDALDAVFDYEHDPTVGGSFPIGGHTSQRFSFHLSWSDGCMDDNSAGIFTQAPTVVLGAGPWHIAKSWDGPGYAFLGGKNTVAASCNS